MQTFEHVILRAYVTNQIHHISTCIRLTTAKIDQVLIYRDRVTSSMLNNLFITWPTWDCVRNWKNHIYIISFINFMTTTLGRMVASSCHRILAAVMIICWKNNICTYFFNVVFCLYVSNNFHLDPQWRSLVFNRTTIRNKKTSE